jgi:hypothetical protein
MMSDTPELRSSWRHRPSWLRPWGRLARRVTPRAAAVAALALLSSCDDDHDCCYNYYQTSTPYEVSYGMVGASFGTPGAANPISIVQTNTVKGGVGPYSGTLMSYLYTGPGTFAAPVVTSAGDNPLYLAVGDFNGDKLTDLVAASYADGALEVFFNNAQAPGSFNPPLLLSSPGASQVAVGDMNGDGLADLVSADYNVSLFLQTSPGTFAAPITLYSGGANWVAVGDLNNDGIPDVALTDNLGVKLLLHTGAAGTTTYAAPVSVFTATATSDYIGANLIAIADVNGDGFKDLVITDPGPAGGSAPTVSVLLQDAAHPGTFLAPVAYATAPGSLAQDIAVKDVNGDGLPDIVIGGNAAVSVLLQNPAAPGTFLAASNYAVQDANQIVIADVHDSDLVAGLPDIIVSTGPTHPVVNGISTNHPGILKSIATAPGTFTALQDLP